MVRWIILQYIINKIEKIPYLTKHPAAHFTIINSTHTNFIFHWNLFMFDFWLPSICSMGTAVKKTDNNVFCKYHSNDEHIILIHITFKAQSSECQENCSSRCSTHANCSVKSKIKKKNMPTHKIDLIRELKLE